MIRGSPVAIGYGSLKGHMMDIIYQRTLKMLGEALESNTKKVSESPEEAKKALVESGIYQENGKLSPNFRPPCKRNKPGED